MLLFLLIFYFFSKTTVTIYFTFCFLLTLLIYLKSIKYYHPKISENSNFHTKYSAFSRRDGHLVSFGRVFFGVLGYFLIKFVLVVGSTIVIGLYFKLFCNNPKLSLEEKRKQCSFACNFFLSIFLCGAGVFVDEKQADCMEIYKKYLGDDYTPPSDYEILLTNHTSWMDIIYLLKRYACSFVSKESVKHYPIVGGVCNALNGVYIDRTSKEDRSEAVKLIQERVEKIKSSEILEKLCLFPEGTTTNGEGLIKFKVGAFLSLTSIKPLLIQNSDQADFRIASGAMDMILHFSILFCFEYIRITCLELPIIHPTEYMFNKFSHLGSNQAEIYQNVTRKMLSEISGLSLIDVSFDNKLEYLSNILETKVKNT